MLDAPVSGGVPAAEAGALTFIVGGTEEGMERARPLLEAMGKNILHCGEAGAGCVAKVLCCTPNQPKGATLYLSSQQYWRPILVLVTSPPSYLVLRVGKWPLCGVVVV